MKSKSKIIFKIYLYTYPKTSFLIPGSKDYLFISQAMSEQPLLRMPFKRRAIFWYCFTAIQVPAKKKWFGILSTKYQITFFLAGIV